MPVQASAERATTAVRADGARVAAIRNSLDPNDPASVAALGARAQSEVTACIEQLREAGRDADFAECADLVRHLRARLDQLDPAALQTKRGLGGLFDSRGRRLKHFRERFVDVVREAAAGAADLSTRTKRLVENSGALDALHDRTRAVILEIDACIEAGRARLAEMADPAPAQDGEAPSPSLRDRLSARIETLTGLRAVALNQLPLVRMAQNAGACSADALNKAMAAVASWREDWGQALGMDRRARVRPDPDWLTRARQTVAEVLDRAEATLASARTRLGEADQRMARNLEAARGAD